jgi:polysaccharide export outer membrane protein
MTNLKKYIVHILIFFFISSQIYADQFIIGELKTTKKNKLQKIEELSQLHIQKKTKYRIGPGDTFNCYVYGEDDLTTHKALIKPDGYLSLRLVGEIFVEGYTITEAEKKIEKNLAEFIKYPKVSLIPLELHTSRFTIIGKIQKPGNYLLGDNTKVLDAIAYGGGFTTGHFHNITVEMADLEHSFLSRKSKILPISFVDLIQKGDMMHNIPLQDGDYIFIASAMNKEVGCMGEVKKPGFFGHKENITLFQILSKAGGLKGTACDQMIVIRNGFKHPRVYSFSFNEIVQGKRRDPKLEPDDVIFVPKSPLGTWSEIFSLVLPIFSTTSLGTSLYDRFDGE